MLLHTRFLIGLLCFLSQHTYVFYMVCVRKHNNKIRNFKCVILFDIFKYKKNFKFVKFFNTFFALFLFIKNYQFETIVSTFRFLRKLDFCKINFILLNQIVILIVYHSCDNNFQWFLDHDASLNELLLAVIIMHKHNSLRMNVFPYADVISFESFILQLNVLNTY